MAVFPHDAFGAYKYVEHFSDFRPTNVHGIGEAARSHYLKSDPEMSVLLEALNSDISSSRWIFAADIMKLLHVMEGVTLNAQFGSAYEKLASSGDPAALATAANMRNVMGEEAKAFYQFS